MNAAYAEKANHIFEYRLGQDCEPFSVHMVSRTANKFRSSPIYARYDDTSKILIPLGLNRTTESCRNGQTTVNTTIRSTKSVSVGSATKGL